MTEDYEMPPREYNTEYLTADELQIRVSEGWFLVIAQLFDQDIDVTMPHCTQWVCLLSRVIR